MQSKAKQVAAGQAPARACIHSTRQLHTPARPGTPSPAFLTSPPLSSKSLPRPARALRRLPRPQPGAGQPAFLPASLPAQRWEVAFPGMRSRRQGMRHSRPSIPPEHPASTGYPARIPSQLTALGLLLLGTWGQKGVRYRGF